MAEILPSDHELLERAGELPDAEYGTRIYSMTALLALAMQRDRFERELVAARERMIRAARRRRIAVTRIIPATAVATFAIVATATTLDRLHPAQQPPRSYTRVSSPLRLARPEAPIMSTPRVARVDTAARPSEAARPPIYLDLPRREPASALRDSTALVSVAPARSVPPASGRVVLAPKRPDSAPPLAYAPTPAASPAASPFARATVALTTSSVAVRAPSAPSDQELAAATGQDVISSREARDNRRRERTQAVDDIRALRLR